MIVVFLLTSRFLSATDLDQLQRSFLDPADESRMMVRWWWFGPAVTRTELEREMKLMKEGGMGGFEVQPTYPLALDGELPGLVNLKFMSPEFLEALGFAAAKARELGLRMDLTLGSGWPYGGPQFSPEESATSIEAQNLTIPGGSRGASLPKFREGQKLIAAFLVSGDRYKELPVAGDTLQLPPDLTGEAQVQLYISRGGIMAVKRPAYGAEGRVIDHYSPTSIARFIKEVAGPEVRACGSNPPYAVFCDSLEVGSENWTEDFLAEFQRRRGYELRPWLPALFNDMGPKTLEIRHDWGQTATELFNERFNSAFKKFANQNHSRFRIQGYGTPPAALHSYAYADLPEGEGYQWKGFSTSRWAASAGHLLGKPVISSETFTWLHSPVFRATPVDMKSEADMHFLSGINQILCHGWPYTAEGVPYPGWSFYAAAVFNEKNPWWIVMPDIARYLQRISSVLRQGTPANDVALYLPNSDAWAGFGRNFSLNAALQGKVSDVARVILESGYNFDFFDDQLLDMRGKVEGKALAFGTVQYKAVVLPGVERMPPATMRVLERFARAGGIVVATRRLPDLAPGYKATDRDTRTVRESAERLFKASNAPGLFVENEGRLETVLAKHLTPDVALSPSSTEIGFTHRHTEGGEVYFVANTGNRPRSVKAAFRVSGMQPELWDPMNGRIRPARMVDRSPATTTINLELEPYGSVIVVLSKRPLQAPPSAAKPVSVPQPVDLSTGWVVRFGPARQPVTMERLVSWSDLPAMRNYSGVATYEKTLTVGPEMLKKDLTLLLLLGEAAPSEYRAAKAGMGYRTALEAPVRDAAVLYVNDHRAGSVWAPPYSIDVTDRLKAGDNRIRIEVGNLAMNHMAGIKLPNYNYDGVAKHFGSRFQPQNLDLVEVLPSGLLGPIRLVAHPKSAW
jgi:hypothetical protein